MINPPQKLLQTTQKIFYIQILNTLSKRIFSAIKNEFTADRAKAFFNDLAFLCITQMKCLLFVGLGAVLNFIDAAILTCFIVDHHVKLAAGIELKLECFHRTGGCLTDFQQNNVLQHPALYIVQNLSCDICLICFGNRCKIGILHQGVD